MKGLDLYSFKLTAMKITLDFLADLKQNNNREWFNANKQRYLDAKAAVDELVNQVIPDIRKFDPDIGTITAKECVFRIYRDVRFSKDKSPYKTNMGGFIARGGRKGGFAGYYIHIDPAGSFVAGGNYMPPADILKKIRQEIMYNIDEFKAIISKPSFRKTYGELEGDKLSRPPKDFPADFPDIELLKFKSFTVLHPTPAKTLLDEDVVNYIVKAFKELHPLNRFLNKALA